MATNHLVCCERIDESKYRHKCVCPSAVVECESSEQDAELCGFSEFAGDGFFASTPPKKYTTSNLSNTNTLKREIGGCEAGSPSGTFNIDLIVTFSGSSTFDGCSQDTNTRKCNWDYTIDDPPNNSTGDSNLSFGAEPFQSFCGFTLSSCTGSDTRGTTVISTTEKKASGIACCVTGGRRGKVTLNCTSAISTEDTETDALNRATPSAGTSCSSIWETRSTGFEFTKRTSGYTIECEDLVIGYEYEVTPAIRKRTAVIDNFGAWEDVSVTPVSFTATAKTETVDDGGNPIDLNNIQGFEYEITGANIEKKA